MQDPISRRYFLQLAGKISAGFFGLQAVASSALAAESPAPGQVLGRGYGALRTDPKGILNLPKGFSYRIISQHGTVMDDGFFVPGKPDGMATFLGPEGKTIIVRNHELSPEMNDLGAFGEKLELLRAVPKSALYDFGGGKLPGLGGTTTLVYDTKTHTVEKEFLSLAGTIRNCAGGPTPWNTWITCEETVLKNVGDLEQTHGYNFEVPASHIPQLYDPVPLKAMGRFQHEAVAVEPNSGIVYQTEDRHDGVIYRFLPKVPGKLHKGGKLQALAIRDRKSFDTRNWAGLKTERFPKNLPLPVMWIDVEDVESPDDQLRYQSFEAGAARFARGEGMWYGNEEVFFACTNGGIRKQGQIFRYVPSPYEGTSREGERPATLELFIEPNRSRLLENCDNLTVSPFGDLMVCEDNLNPRILGVTPSGEIYPFAHNIGFMSEFAGVCFSPDGSTMFVNIQHANLTFAITGPFRRPEAQAWQTFKPSRNK
ncbi:alkaline phosphatase PhoX [Pontibacter sp. G13]|uniref:alkaline phosphatase PhoX n=1 Tax=Pontibacter sp. G13 TaxID=3074898 RepID=UPI00288AFF5C|nr:alkaline phosphatase PhoX [Pontibacter sp. G13]WNJ17764.1 DUF839 domain-containing protein [Pontibacter sp. G13]